MVTTTQYQGLKTSFEPVRARFDHFKGEIDWELKGGDFATQMLPRQAREGGLLGFSSSPHQGMISPLLVKLLVCVDVLN